jgi:hypothetical protein
MAKQINSSIISVQEPEEIIVNALLLFHLISYLQKKL